MIDLDWTLIVQIVNFLALVFLLNLVLFRPIRKSLRERQSRLQAYETDLATLAETRQGLLGEVDEKLTEARREALGLRERLRQEGTQAEASLLEQVKREVEEEWARVEAKIKADVEKARKALQAQAQDFALALAAKILGRKLS
jgi:F-type H+-transporting ATPase subunit b|uniref:ATP synthase subunit b n=1 Tax=Desulfobacca acetoxidans TaxID=60893 RepID=A0A7C5AKW7_9BACT